MLEAVAVFVRQSHSAVHMVDQPYRNEQILPGYDHGVDEEENEDGCDDNCEGIG